MSLKNWLIHKLGGYTQEDKQAFDASYSQYMTDNIEKIKRSVCLKNGESRTNTDFYDGTVYIVGDDVLIHHSRFTGAKVTAAPWVARATVRSCIFSPKPEVKSLEETLIENLTKDTSRYAI